jgi:hypothetical protein
VTGFFTKGTFDEEEYQSFYRGVPQSLAKAKRDPEFAKTWVNDCKHLATS